MDSELPLNLLLITCDQYRHDCLSCADHPVMRTPGLDMLATEGVRFASHFGQAAPCAPGRASLYTGQYLMNHRVVGNSSPLEDRHANFAASLRTKGCELRPACHPAIEAARFAHQESDATHPRLPWLIWPF